MLFPRLPPALVFIAILLGLGSVAAAVSLGVQRIQTNHTTVQAAQALTGGHVASGRALFAEKGCGGCHSITGQNFANGAVGPSLDKVAIRAFLAGKLANDPQQMTAWIQHPQALDPGSGMPEMGLTDGEARDLAAYLYILR
ncbi:c-type cytochrome [Phenylobacterium sp.]|jgi:cytochrome c2|uniref:c-type cytochrome n=1 Tax=Phenylobacterium sp. TaxID=1871053 RepID=UPI002F400709